MVKSHMAQDPTLSPVFQLIYVFKDRAKGCKNVERLLTWKGYQFPTPNVNLVYEL